ncbi:hypothetical protein H4R23_002050, partial [Coemansia sp. Cherry 401B]
MRLPFDVAVLVARHLGVRDLLECWQVCRRWQRLFTSDAILYPVFLQLSHFEQESFMFQCLPNSHSDDAEPAAKDGAAETERSRLDDEMRLEERASQQWLKDRRVL